MVGKKVRVKTGRGFLWDGAVGEVCWVEGVIVLIKLQPVAPGSPCYLSHATTTVDNCEIVR